MVKALVIFALRQRNNDCRYLASHGFVAVTIDYRLVPAAIYPGGYEFQGLSSDQKQAVEEQMLGYVIAQDHP